MDGYIELTAWQVAIAASLRRIAQVFQRQAVLTYGYWDAVKTRCELALKRFLGCDSRSALLALARRLRFESVCANSKRTSLMIVRIDDRESGCSIRPMKPEENVPGPEQIRELTERIRQSWTPRELCRRSNAVDNLEMNELPLRLGSKYSDGSKGLW